MLFYSSRVNPHFALKLLDRSDKEIQITADSVNLV